MSARNKSVAQRKVATTTTRRRPAKKAAAKKKALVKVAAKKKAAPSADLKATMTKILNRYRKGESMMVVAAEFGVTQPRTNIKAIFGLGEWTKAKEANAAARGATVRAGGGKRKGQVASTFIDDEAVLRITNHAKKDGWNVIKTRAGEYFVGPDGEQYERAPANAKAALILVTGNGLEDLRVRKVKPSKLATTTTKKAAKKVSRKR